MSDPRPSASHRLLSTSDRLLSGPYHQDGNQDHHQDATGHDGDAHRPRQLPMLVAAVDWVETSASLGKRTTGLGGHGTTGRVRDGTTGRVGNRRTAIGANIVATQDPQADSRMQHKR